MANKEIPAIEARIGKALKLKRVDADMSQTELAKRVGMSPQQIHQYEKGLNRLPVSRLIEFSDVLGFKPGEFVERLVKRKNGQNP